MTLSAASKRETIFKASLIAAACLVAYLGGLSGKFIYDDKGVILSNHWLRSFSHLNEILTEHHWAFSFQDPKTYYRPVSHLLNFALYQGFGPSPLAFHLASVILHAANAVLLYLVGRKFLDLAGAEGKDWIPFAGALLFAVHPINAEAVSWVAASSDLLYSLFAFSSLLCYLHSGREDGSFSRGYLLLSVVFFFLSALSKENGAVVPGILIAADIALGRAGIRGVKRGMLACLPYLLVFLAYMAARRGVLGSLLEVPNKAGALAGDFSANAVRSFVWYGKMLLWPSDYAILRDAGGPETLAGGEGVLYIFIALAVLSAIFFVVRKRRELLFGAALFLLPLMPPLYASAKGILVAERYLYLSSAGFCLLAATLIFRISGQSERAALRRNALLAALAVICLFATVGKTEIFKDEYSLWSVTIENSPEFPDSHAWYASALFARGRVEEGMRESETAIHMGLSGPDIFFNYATALLESGRAEEAAIYFMKYLELKPLDAEGHLRLGDAYERMERFGEGLAEYREALRIDPSFAEAREGEERILKAR